MKKLWSTQRQATFSKAAVILGFVLVFSFSSVAAGPQDQAKQPATSAQNLTIPMNPIEEAQKSGTAFPVSLKDLTKLALQNNLDIAISDTNEEINQNKVLQAYGSYDPTISLSLGTQSRINANTNATNQSTEGYKNSLSYAQWNATFAQNIPTGGDILATFNSNRSDTNQKFALFNPQFNSSASIQFTQPLWRNRRTDQYRSTIKLYNLDVKISDSNFKSTVTSTIAGIQSSYWDLVYAIRGYDIALQSVSMAQIQVNNNKEEVRIGVLAPIEITVAQADAATRMVDLLSARKSILIAENNLRSMISNDRNSEIWHKVIVPTESPEFVEYKMDLDQAIDTALQKRPELEQINLQMQQNEINYNFGRDQKKWQVNFVGQFGVVGVGGPQITAPDGTLMVPPALVGGLGTAYKTLFSQGLRSWFTGFNVQIPLRNRNVEGQMGQLQVQRRQLLLNRKNQEQKINVQIRNAFQDLETNKQSVEAARVARELAQAQLDGETKRFQAGMSQNFLVLQRQTDLAQRQGQELQALIAYKKSIITLQQAMYTLLDANDFEIAGSGSAAKPEHFK